MALITPLKGLAAPTTLTVAKSLNVNNQMMDVPGMISSAILKAQELKQQLALIVAVTDAADPNLTALNAAVANLA